jgi:hypothetical protein
VAEAVYILCAVTSLACAVLLVRGYLESRTRLLLWCCLGFGGLAAGNLFVVLDTMVFRGVNLILWRQGAALAGLTIMACGLAWESRRGSTGVGGGN